MGRERSGRITRRYLLGATSALILAQALCPERLRAAVASLHQPVSTGSFKLIRDGQPASIFVESSADSAVKHAADNLATDLERVSGRTPLRSAALDSSHKALMIIGVIGSSPVIDELVRSGKIDVADIEGEWEAYRQIVVDNPLPGVERALVVVGADRRGAVYGIYDLSEQMGVSPWHWFADVPVPKKANLIIANKSRRDQPKVRYRGFFINDEDPAFSSWAKKRFGGVNSRAYAHVFELLLRLKGNYLWPAMWAPKAFNDDDPESKILADAMGVVMGSSHHEPMTRAQDEWHRHTEDGVTGGAWDYTRNAENLRTFWRGGIERMMSKGDSRGYESLVTIGMRGDGDEAMGEGTAIGLLERIVADQRGIIAEVTGRPAEETPQIWALYKEVQDYYDKGMQVPDDVTLLFSDDNWGQIRRLPTTKLDRKGGYGVYYHFDYVGGPRNYKWINTVQIEKVWQQMDLAYARGARAVWIVNVGDIKPMEFPLSFFMKQAWNPEAMTVDALARYPEDWARATFGHALARSVGGLVTRYSQLAARRKPELVDADSFSLGEYGEEQLDGGEFGAIVAEWLSLEADMRRIKAAVSKEQSDAFFQLVEHPILAFSNLYQLYYAVAWNRRLAAANDARANSFADRAETAFRRDAAIATAYHALNGGKWDGMMSQTHIGYTSWQQPERQIMPAIKRIAAPGEPSPILFKAASQADAVDEIAIEAPHYARAFGGKDLEWCVIPNLGRLGGAVTTLPQGRPATSIGDDIRLEYDVVLNQDGDIMVDLYMVPTLNTISEAPLRMGISIDDRAVQLVQDFQSPASGPVSGAAQQNWTEAVKSNARVLRAHFGTCSAGKHIVKIWRIDDNIVLQKLVLRDAGDRGRAMSRPADVQPRREWARRWSVSPV